MSWLRRTAPPWRRKRREHLAPFISLCRAMEVLHADVHKLRVAGISCEWRVWQTCARYQLN